MRAIGVMSLVMCWAVGLAAPATAARSAPVGLQAQTFSTPAMAEGNARFLDGAVRDLLGRASSPADAERWLPGLEHGQPRSELAGQIARTKEWTSVVVVDLYAQVFNRAPDRAGLLYWSGQLVGGMPTSALAAFLYESTEFYEAAGSTGGGFVDRLYLTILHRLPDDGGRAYWIAQLDRGLPRSTLARLIFLSIEGNGERVDALYSRLLNRGTDPAGRDYWAQILTTNDDFVLAGLLAGSPEYFTAAQARYTSATVTTAPGTAVLVAPYVESLGFNSSGTGTVAVALGGQVPAVGGHMLISTDAWGFVVGTATAVTSSGGGSTVTFVPADLTDVLSSADIRSTVELPRSGIEPIEQVPTNPSCAAESADLEVAHRTTTDVAFNGRLAFDRASGSYDVAAVVTVTAHLTALMSSVARTSDCTSHGYSHGANWHLSIQAGPIAIPLTAHLLATFDVDASIDAGFRSSTTASVPCSFGFTASDAGPPVSAVGCGALGGRSSVDPGGTGIAVDHTIVSADVRIGAHHTGISTAGHLEPSVTTTADRSAEPWWTVDLTVEGGAVGHLRLTPWAADAQAALWPTARIATRRLAQAPPGSLPPPPVVIPPKVSTGWLRHGAVGQPYAMELSASEGVPPYTWSAQGLPAGLALVGDRITGSPTVAGTTSVAVSVTDGVGQAATRALALVVGPTGSPTEFDRVTEGANGLSTMPELSADGRHVVFLSDATNLVPGDDNGDADLFTFDQATGVMIKVTDGKQSASVIAHEPWSVSTDGRFIAFQSDPPPVGPGDFVGTQQIFLWDRTTGASTQVTTGNLTTNQAPSVSTDGDVAFASREDLVPGDDNDRDDIFLWTRATSALTRLSGPDGGNDVVLSGDGTTVAFDSPSGAVVLDLATGQRTVEPGVYLEDLSSSGRFVASNVSGRLQVLDRTTGLRRSIDVPRLWTADVSDAGSVAYEAEASVGGVFESRIWVWDGTDGSVPDQIATSSRSAYGPEISADGSTVTLGSTDPALVPGDTNGLMDIFLWHRPPAG